MRPTILVTALSLTACTTIGDGLEPGPGEQKIDDDTVGVALVVPDTWRIAKDPVLFDTHGFLVYEAADNHAEPVARVALAYQASSDKLADVVADKLAKYVDVSPQREDIVLGDGRPAVAITGLPGTEPYAVVYTSDGGRVYELGFWSQTGGLDDRAHSLLDHLRFKAPTADARTIGLPSPHAALHGEPPGELAAARRAANERRRAQYATAAAADPGLRVAAARERADTTARQLDAGCGFFAPSDLYWQLQWDDSNTFYSGSWYDLASTPGWSAMSGNYGSWWGTNFHVGLCYANYLNQYYANDWPAQYWANAYAAFSGYVEWADWGTDGFASLGRFVIVRNGLYRSLTAHLSAIADGITWGTWIDGYSTVIGWAGDSGETYAGADWAPHIHARVAWGESLTWNGQPYGGQSVGPTALRCFQCTDYDVEAAGAGGYYTDFYYGRWMYY